MEKKSIDCKEMYRYTTTGTTLYDLLGEYLGEDDFSAKGVINSLRRDLNLQQDTDNRKDFMFLTNTYRKSIAGKLVNSMLHNLTPEEESSLLEKLQGVNPEKYNFEHLIQYINFLEDTNFSRSALEVPTDESQAPALNQDIEKINQVLIDEATQKADPQVVSGIRNAIIHMLLIRYVKKQIVKECSDKDFSQNPKYQKIELFNRVFSNKELIEEYDSAVAYSKQKEEEAIKKVNLETNCKLSRIAALSKLTGKPVTQLLEKIDSRDACLIDFLSTQVEKDDKKKYTPREGDYKWSFKKAPSAKVIYDEPVEFSENGEENQTLFVTTLGNLSYGNTIGKFSYGDLPLELIGVTLFGEDGNKNYFLFTTHGNIRNMMNGTNREYYKKVLLSEFVLNDAVAWKDRFLPEMVFDEKGNALLSGNQEVTLMGMNPENAVKYATLFKGDVGTGRPRSTLQELCNSQALLEMQMKALQASRMKETDRGEY